MTVPLLQRERTVSISYAPLFNSEDMSSLRVPYNDRIWSGDTAGLSLPLMYIGAGLSFSSGSGSLTADGLRELGFGNIADEPDSPTEDGIGLTIAEKRLRNRIVTAIVLRGTVGKEWYSNFEIGYAAEHRGFSKAADCAERRLGDYIGMSREKGRRVFFVTGYSRGGAVANILSKRLCDSRGSDCVFAYTFASPNTASCYPVNCPNIFNIVRREDFFTHLPPKAWGFRRYGRDIVLSADVGERFKAITGKDYLGSTEPSAVEAAISAAAALAPDIRAYYERRRPVGDRMLSLYEYMKTVARLLADDADESAGEILIDSVVSQYADLSLFLSAGVDIAAYLSPAAGIPRCAVSDSHSPAAYVAAMESRLPLINGTLASRNAGIA